MFTAPQNRSPAFRRIAQKEQLQDYPLFLKRARPSRITREAYAELTKNTVKTAA